MADRRGKCWAALGMPAGKRLAPMLPKLVVVLRRFGELDIDEDTAALLSQVCGGLPESVAVEHDSASPLRYALAEPAEGSRLPAIGLVLIGPAQSAPPKCSNTAVRVDNSCISVA
jgi:hypothetical protein